MTSSLSKPFERVLQKQIVEFLHYKSCFSEMQFGFGNNCSTIDALFYCTESFRLAVNNNRNITAALLDLSKAFDSVKHNVLKEKLIPGQNPTEQKFIKVCLNHYINDLSKNNKVTARLFSMQMALYFSQNIRI